MKSAKLRLALAFGLFAVWITWLGYLALPSTTPREVLSHAQFLVSQVDAIARVETDDNGNLNPVVRIEAVSWPPEQAKDLVGQTVRITNLYRMTDRDPITGRLVHQGWNGPGSYIFALQPDGTDYRIAPVPRSPGYDRMSLRIYAATPQNRQQLVVMPKPSVVK